MSTPLEYASPQAKRMFAFPAGIPIAIACALLPMIVGTAAYVAWYWTGDDDFQLLGALTLMGGLLLFCGGLVVLILYAYGEIVHKTTSGRRLAGRVAIALVLLLVNFPLAKYFIGAAARNAIVVDVTNLGTTALKDVRLIAPSGVIESLGDIAPGQTVRGRIGATGDGELAITYSNADGSVRTITIEEYVTNGTDGRYTVDTKDGSEVVKKVK